MTHSKMIVFLILAAMLLLFPWRRLRHDEVAFTALMACVATRLVSEADPFDGLPIRR